MSDRSRRRSSKWDLKEDLPHPVENIRGRGRESEKVAPWDGDGGYSTRMSPGLDNDWRRPNHRHSPSEKWDRPLRNRSRSRSRSPVRGFRQDSGNYDRSRSRSAPLCRDFGAGRCRRGSDCPFVHQGNRNYGDSWEDRHRKGGMSKYPLAHDATEYPSRGSSERELERNRNSDIICKYFASGNCHNGRHCRFSHGKTGESPERKMDGASKYWEEPRWKETGPGRDAGNFENVNGRRGALDQRVNDQLPDGRRESLFEKGNRTWNEPTSGASSVIPSETKPSEGILDDVDMSPDWNYRPKSSNLGEDEHRQNTFSSPVPTSLHSIPGQDTSWNGAVHLNHSASANKDMRFNTPGISPSDMNFSSNVLHGQGFDQNRQSLGAIALPNLNSVVHPNMAVVPREGPINQPNNGAFVEGKLIEGPTFSQINEIPPNNNSARGEQLTQLNNLSASLVQILEAGTQLPQLYAAPQPPPEDPMEQVKSIMPNTAVAPQEQYAHVYDDVDQQRVINVDGLKRAPDVDQADGAKTGISNQVGSLEGHDPKDTIEEVAEGSKKADESKEAGDDDQTDLENVDGVKKEDGKKHKETKTPRAFKFALAECVKELLKPSWKDGLFGKDAYKTIVKKVVDKVTGSLQGASIPHSKEKIDHYLSASKPKLTKLVQAYVGKFQKPNK